MTTWLITGANRGIGLGLTRLLLKRGDKVIAACREPARADELAALKTAHGEALAIIAIDVTSARSVASAAEALAGPIDVLVNNAGIYGPRDRQGALDMDFEAFEDVLRVNTVAPLRVAQAFLPQVTAAKGKIITISSQMGSVTTPSTGALAYRASKAAVNKVMQGFAAEVRGRDVTCVVMHPGWVRTDMGGSGASLSVDQSTSGIVKVIDGLRLADTGSFRNFDGSVVPW